MTVHGAKGLEAPIVILPDTAQVPKQTERILWSGEGAAALPLWVRRKGFDEELARTARAHRDAAQADEYRRLLYVGLTRAADRLYLCGWDSRKSGQPLSWYEHLVATLSDKGEALNFAPAEQKPEGWDGPSRAIAALSTAPPDKDKAQGLLALAPPSPPPWLNQPVAPEPEPWRPVAPSRPSIAEPGLLSPLRQTDAQATRFGRGLLIHRLLQSLPRFRRRAEGGGPTASETFALSAGRDRA